MRCSDSVLKLSSGDEDSTLAKNDRFLTVFKLHREVESTRADQILYTASPSKRHRRRTIPKRNFIPNILELQYLFDPFCSLKWMETEKSRNMGSAFLGALAPVQFC